MKLLCHRGIWRDPAEKNAASALNEAITKGLGVETDIRDCNGRLVISHDAPTDSTAGSLEAFFGHYRDSGRHPTLALNIKSDGLQQGLKAMLTEYGIANYFVFDMSVPDTLGYRKANMPFAARLSEWEDAGRLLQHAQYVWLDAFDREWYSISVIEQLLKQGKHVAVVSPELHRRPHADLWATLKSIDDQDRLYLCTDFVDQALETFHVQKD